MRKFFTIIIICISALALGGCGGELGSIYSNYRELEYLQLIQTVGVDRSGDGEVTLTVSSGRDSDTAATVLLSRSGLTLTDAMASLQDYAASSELFYAHSRYMLLGEATARHGVGQYLDYVERSNLMRTGMTLYLVRGGTVKELMTGTAEDYDITGVIGEVERDIRKRGAARAFTCGETARALADTGAALIAAVRVAQTEGSVFSSDSGVTAIPDGFGILLDGCLVGEISPECAPEACLLGGWAGETDIDVPDAHGNTVTCVLSRSELDITPLWDGGRLDELDITLKIQASATEFEGEGRFSERGYLSALSEALSEKIHERASAVLEKSRVLRADFLNLGARVRPQNPELFDALGGGFASALADARIRLHVESVISDGYDLTASARTDGSSAVP